MPILTVQGFPPTPIAAGLTLLEACEDADIPMDCACGGFASCNSCRVVVISGKDHLSEVTEDETPFLDEDNQRLGCQAQVHGDVEIRLAPGM